MVGEPLLAVPAVKSMVVWKIPAGCFSLTAINPLLWGSQEIPSMPMLSMVVLSLTVWALALVKVVPGI